MQKQDRRRQKRLKAYHLVKCKRVFSQEGTPAVTISAGIQDIGSGGVRLSTDTSLSLSNLLELRIHFPALQFPLSTLAKVVWIKHYKKTKRYEVGAQFVGIEDSVRKTVDERIQAVYKRIENKMGFVKKFLLQPIRGK